MARLTQAAEGTVPPPLFGVLVLEFCGWSAGQRQEGRSTVVAMVLVSCPECAADLELDGVVAGEIVQCGECSVELEVLSVEPVELALAPTEEEDWGE